MRTIDLICAFAAVALAAWSTFTFVDTVVLGHEDREILYAVLTTAVFGTILGGVATAIAISHRREWSRSYLFCAVVGTASCFIVCCLDVMVI